MLDQPSGPNPRRLPGPWGAVFALPCLVVTYFGASLAADGDNARTRACGAVAALTGLAAVAYCASARHPVRAVTISAACLVVYLALAFGLAQVFRD